MCFVTFQEAPFKSAEDFIISVINVMLSKACKQFLSCKVLVYIFMEQLSSNIKQY